MEIVFGMIKGNGVVFIQDETMDKEPIPIGKEKNLCCHGVGLVLVGNADAQPDVDVRKGCAVFR